MAIGPSASSALVFWAISRAAASRSFGSDVGRLLADQTLELAGQSLDLADVLLLARQQVLGLGKVGQAERSELALGPRLGIAQLRLHLGPAAQPSVDLDVAHLGLELVAPPQPQRDGGHDDADDRDQRSDRLDREAEVGDAQELRAGPRRRR